MWVVTGRAVLQRGPGGRPPTGPHWVYGRRVVFGAAASKAGARRLAKGVGLRQWRRNRVVVRFKLKRMVP